MSFGEFRKPIAFEESMSHIQARRVGERTNSVLSLPKPVLVCALSHICTSYPQVRGHRSDDVGAGHCETLPLSHIAPGHAPREHLIRAHCNFSGQLIIVKT